SLDLCMRLSRRSHTNARIRPRIRPTASPLGSTRLFLGELGCFGAVATVTMCPPEVSAARLCSLATLLLSKFSWARSDDRVDWSLALVGEFDGRALIFWFRLPISDSNAVALSVRLLICALIDEAALELRFCR